jgi:hypothetical protein
MNLESANLILRTSSVEVGDNKNANNTNITWTNISLKNVLGNLFYKYDKFKICLTSFGNTNTSALTAIADRIMTVNMTGFQWYNQTYDSSINANTSNVIISTVDFISGAGRNINYAGEIGWVFIKPQTEFINININLSRCSDGGINPAINYGASVFCFSIYGIEE